ncbi:plasmid pRiA4b ORF-3 family protein [Gimesia chilikensis]|uniref:plasmid pRiA4b ORF-3 family protein n=1 Tax=Gimesia chilikensis TaxID=2605989 RepID=UPI0018E08D18|nr:plasmid pRiA4b ORF-3 family protein [Gimesia chilikensis]
MPTKKQIQPDEKVPLKLTTAERKLILGDLACVDQDYEQIIQETPVGKPIMMTLDALNDFGNYFAAEFNHCDDEKQQKKLSNILNKIQHLLDTYTDEESPQILKIEDAYREKVISDQVVEIVDFVGATFVAAEKLRIKTKPLDNFWLEPDQRDMLLLVPGLSKRIKNKLVKEKPLTVVEVAKMTLSLAEDLPNGEIQNQIALLLMASHLMDRLEEGIMARAEQLEIMEAQSRPQANPDLLYQFKVTLLGLEPQIWRRIQVQDCTLDKLHEHIQTAMGWDNMHLHQFEINGERYGDPDLLDDGFGDFVCFDSTATTLCQILPKTKKRFSFKYDYDFGDGWEHEIFFEGQPPLEKNRKYPLCLEGEQACPPEDIGGVWGYAEYLEALDDPQHERHEEFKDWIGPFDPHKFDPKQATRKMKKGLPDWREM